jgi:hypothetical protein
MVIGWLVMVGDGWGWLGMAGGTPEVCIHNLAPYVVMCGHVHLTIYVRSYHLQPSILLYINIGMYVYISISIPIIMCTCKGQGHMLLEAHNRCCVGIVSLPNVVVATVCQTFSLQQKDTERK